MKAKAPDDSGSEEEQEHFKFETLNIWEEWCKYRTPHNDDAEVPETATEAEKGLYKISHIINPTKKGKNRHYTPVLLGSANVRLGKSKYHTLRILLDSSTSSLILLVNNTHNLRHKKTQPVKWITQGDDFLTTYKTNVELVRPELDVTKSVTWNFHVNDSQKNSRYYMSIGRYLLL